METTIVYWGYIGFTDYKGPQECLRHDFYLDPAQTEAELRFLGGLVSVSLDFRILG